MAYAFARFRFPGRRSGLLALLVGALLPPVAMMTPLYILLSALQLRTSLLGLMIVYAAFSMPFCIWNMRSAFQAVPAELEEAAFLDGASHWKAYWRVTLPLALPAIALGVNQVVMMVLAMVVVAGLVGGAGLGLEAVIGLAKTQTGRGLEAGLAIVIIAMIMDRITQAWARKRDVGDVLE